MTKHKIKTTWLGEMAFEADYGSHKQILDTDESHGGNNSGPKPKMLLLSALAACTGMDIVPLLKKMKAEVKNFWMETEADINEFIPHDYPRIRLTYFFEDPAPKIDPILKAVRLSIEKYCAVTAMLKKSIDLHFEIRINGEIFPYLGEISKEFHKI